MKGKFIIQPKDALIQSFQDMKTRTRTEVNGKEVILEFSFIKTWINDENIRNMIVVFTPSPLQHKNELL
jgi:hypothetical protein